jgi:Trm5-related predicted tRNA methylase
MSTETPADDGPRLYGEITTRYGHTILVKESSFADEPRAWLFITDSPTSKEHAPHLSIEDAKALRDALDQFVTMAE